MVEPRGLFNDVRKMFLQIEGHVLEMHHRIDVLHHNIVRYIEIDRGIVEDRADSRIHEPIRHVLGKLGGYRQHRNLNMMGKQSLFQLIDGANDEISHALPNFVRSGVKHPRNAKATLREAAIMRNRAAEISKRGYFVVTGLS